MLLLDVSGFRSTCWVCALLYILELKTYDLAGFGVGRKLEDKFWRRPDRKVHISPSDMSTFMGFVFGVETSVNDLMLLQAIR